VVDIKDIQSKFTQIKNKGYVISTKPTAKKNDGAVGNTLKEN